MPERFPLPDELTKPFWDAANKGQLVAQFPFPVQAVQSDVGSEFLKEFGPTVEELQLAHYFNRPKYPQGNGRIERSFRTDEEEFYQDLLNTHLMGQEVLSDMS